MLHVSLIFSQHVTKHQPTIKQPPSAEHNMSNSLPGATTSLPGATTSLPGATINVANVDPSAGPEEEKPVYKPEGWFHWGFRAMYNTFFFVATSVSYTAHSAVGHSKGDPRKYNAGYWNAPTVSND
jgi:hypothetical protein